MLWCRWFAAVKLRPQLQRRRLCVDAVFLQHWHSYRPAYNNTKRPTTTFYHDSATGGGLYARTLHTHTIAESLVEFLYTHLNALCPRGCRETICRVVIFHTRRWSHQITQATPRIHYSYKLAVLVYQCVHGLAPAYLADALQPVTGLPGRQRLRSSSTSALAVPHGFPRSATERSPSLRQELGTVCHQKWRLHTVCEHLGLNSRLTRSFFASFPLRCHWHFVLKLYCIVLYCITLEDICCVNTHAL